MKPHRQIPDRLPSPSSVRAFVSPHGAALIGLPDGGDFIPMNECLNIYGNVESWLAHQLLRHAGYSGEVEER